MASRGALKHRGMVVTSERLRMMSMVRLEPDWACDTVASKRSVEVSEAVTTSATSLSCFRQAKFGTRCMIATSLMRT